MPDPPLDDEFHLRSPDGPSREELSRQLEPPPDYLPPPPEPPPRFQFSISDMMLLMVGVALGLAGGTWMPPEIFAAAMGLVAIIGLLIAHLYPPETHVGRVLWLALGLAYVLAVLAAVFKPALR